MSEFERRLRRIALDREQGAAGLGREAVQALAAFCADQPCENLSRWLDAVHLAVCQVAECRASMAPVANFALEFERRLRRRLGADASPHVAHARAAAAAREVLDLLESLPGLLVDQGRRHLEGLRQLMTLSHSGTVERLLLEAAPKDCRVFILESRPRLEGRNLALRLRRARLEVTILTEAQAGLYLPECERVLVGADSMGRDLGVVNKAGTFPLAVLARFHEVPFEVAADTFKVRRDLDSEDIPLEEGDPAEVWEGHAAWCRNTYFDRTPPELVSAWITERGVLDAAAFRALLASEEAASAGAVDRDEA